MLTTILKKLSKTDFARQSISSTGRLLCDIQSWLRETRQAVISVTPIDDFDSWHFDLLLPDVMTPFFRPEYDLLNEFETYEKALEAGIAAALENIDSE